MRSFGLPVLASRNPARGRVGEAGLPWAVVGQRTTVKDGDGGHGYVHGYAVDVAGSGLKGHLVLGYGESAQVQAQVRESGHERQGFVGRKGDGR